MSSRNTAVFGLYRDESEIGEAIVQLKRAGFRPTDASILLPQNEGTKDLGYERHTKAPEAAVWGGGAGGLIGGVFAYLVNSGVIAPGADWAAQGIASADPVLAVLAGVGACIVLGAMAGGLLGSARPEYEVKRYDGRVRSNSLLLSVHCDDATWRVRAKETLRSTGAQGIASMMESKAEFGASPIPAPRLREGRALERRTFLQIIPEVTTAAKSEIAARTSCDVPF